MAIILTANTERKVFKVSETKGSDRN